MTDNSRLWSACEKGDLGGVQSAVAGGADINTMVSDSGWTPLIWAIYYKHHHVTAWLLDQPGIHVDTGNSYGKNSLMMACVCETPPGLVSRLGEATEDVNAADNMHGLTALQWAVSEGHVGPVLGLLPVHGVAWEGVEDDWDTLVQQARESNNEE